MRTLTALLLSTVAGFAADYHVETYGVDVGMCSAASPCRTLTYATAKALSNNPYCQQDVIYLGVGAWSESISVTAHCNRITYSGAGPLYTTWNGSPGWCGVVVLNQGTDILFRQMKMEGISDTCQSVIFVQNGGIANLLDGIVFDAAYGSHIHLEGTSQFFAWNNYGIVNGAQRHITAIGGSHVGLGNVHVQIDNGPTIPVFFDISSNASLVLGGTQFHGPLTNSQGYRVYRNASIWSFHGCGGAMPGTQGAAFDGGICQ